MSSYPPTPQRKACNCEDPCISTDDVYYAGPNLPNSGINTYNVLTSVIEKLDAIYSFPTLQKVTEAGNYTTLPIIADSFVKIGGTGTNILLDNGSTVALSSVVGNTNLSTSQTATNFTINSDTGTDASVPLGNGTLAGGTLNDYTTTEKNKLAGIAEGAEVNVNADWNSVSGDSQILNKPTISGTNTGDQNLQQVTDKGNITNKSIIANVALANPAIVGYSQTGNGVYGQSDGKGVYGYTFFDAAVYGYAESVTGIAIKGYAESGVAAEFETDAFSANIANFKKSGVLKAFINNAGELTAEKLIKSGGTASQILAADGSVITAGNNITITGGQISSVGGSGGGGSSVNYYLNGGTSQGPFGGVTYYEFSKIAVIGARVDFSVSSDGYIASFITDVADPSLLLIPIGNWITEFYFSADSAGGSPSFYSELYKVSTTNVFTLIATSSATPEGITNGDVIDAYFTTLSVPETTLDINDRLAIRVFVNASGKTITLHTQDETVCEVLTTFTTGLTALNGLQAQVQNFSLGTAGTDFAINSSGSTHTFNLPSASATARGVVTTTSQTFAGDKTFTGAIGASNLSNTNTGDNATNTQYSGLAASKQDVITLTTTGTSGESTLIGATLNIPQYSGATNLDYIPSPTNGTVTSSTGNSATIPLADATNAGLLKPAKFTVLENTSGTNTGDQNLSGYALLDSPTFTGTPLAPTPTLGDNSTKLATTEYVDRQIGLGGPAYNILISSFPGNAITTETLGTSNGVSYSQNGRNVMINNGATAITITANTLLTPTDFIASYTRLGSATITFLFTGAGATLIQPNGNMLTGSPGSTALLTKNGTTIYLLINNI